MTALMRYVLDILYPPKCMLCRTFLDSSDDALCGRCSHELPECEGPLASVAYYKKSVSPFYYESPIREAILRFKFRGMQTYAEQFAAWMAVWVRDKLAGEYDIISWVPCSSLRRWQRGFDQAELLAKELACELHAEALPTLKKTKHNRKQSKIGSPAQRRANVLGVYRVIDPAMVAGKRILLVDDVLTTGATLSECGKMLQMAGATDLVCVTIARTRMETKE